MISFSSRFLFRFKEYAGVSASLPCSNRLGSVGNARCFFDVTSSGGTEIVLVAYSCSKLRVGAKRKEVGAESINLLKEESGETSLLRELCDAARNLRRLGVRNANSSDGFILSSCLRPLILVGAWMTCEFSFLL